MTDARLRPLPVLAAVTALLAAGACSSGDPVRPDPAPEPIDVLPRQLSSAELEVLAASNRFAFDLARELAPPPSENLFFSPLSASMLLGLLLNGADGDTWTQIRETLAFQDLDEEAINDAYRDLVDLLVGLDPSVTVEIGNSVWAQAGLPLTSGFVDRVEAHFSATVEPVDFADGATLPRINAWVEEATNGAIESIFDRLPPNVVIVLLNAIYFEGDWTEAFDRGRTRTAPFTTGTGSTVQVPLMQLDEEILFARGDGWRAAELAYGGGAFAMTLVLPDEGADAGELLASFDAADWDGLTASLGPGRVMLSMPRFELAWEAELNGALGALGMVDAFGGGADFGRMVEGGGVWIDLIKQKAFVQVDEEGTVAAAVTGGVGVTSAPPSFRLDRPFLLAIRERLTGTILFMGVVNDPRG